RARSRRIRWRIDDFQSPQNRMESPDGEVCFRGRVKRGRSHRRAPGAANAGSTSQNPVGNRRRRPAVRQRKRLCDPESRLRCRGVKKQSRMKIHILDTRQLGHAGIVAATALETDDGIALFDTGPESTYENVIAALRQSGSDAKDVRHVFLSHIHFDHAGAAWRFAELGATVYVHPRGAAHLIDPAKLVESAARIFGDDMQRLWGRIAPVPAERVKILEDNEVIRVAPFEIRAIATPGHASHHHVYHWDDNVFGGDVAGVRIGHGPPIPPMVPPELNVESWRESIAKIR